MEKDLYSILEINENSTEDEIKKSYKNLARKYHPDLNKDKSAEDKFKEINSAYEILGDKSKRKEYDLKRKNHFNFSGKKDYNFNFDFSDLFKDSFGGGFKKSYEEKLDIDISLEITEEMAIYGTKKEINLGFNKITVTIPSGITDGKILRVVGKGKSINNKTGDLYIHIKIKKEKQKNYNNYNYYDDTPSNNKLDLTISFDLPLKIAMFGGKVNINIEGYKTVTLNIPKNTKNGQKFRIKNIGNIDYITRDQGDVYLVSNIIIPKIEELDKTMIKNLKIRLPD